VIPILTYAGATYLDRSWPLEAGIVECEGYDLEYLAQSDIGALFREVCRGAPYDASEMSLSNLTSLVSNGDRRFVAIPVFPSRSFRHSQVYVHAGSLIGQPSDLRGKRVGIVEYHMTAGLWVRAMLEHDFGVRPAEVHWWTTRDSLDYAHEMDFPFPSQVQIDSIPQGSSLDGLLQRGDIDALVTVKAPPSYQAGASGVRRLFPEYRPVEEDYFRRTGHFPIMHTVVLRRDVYEKDRASARALLQAFQKAKDWGINRLCDLNILAIIHPWLGSELNEVVNTFGGDPFAYGFGPNLATLEATTRHSFDQGLSRRKVDPAELFAPETWDWIATADYLRENKW
jgi:4,5-dihydroxyphthalate decarboxylase